MAGDAACGTSHREQRGRRALAGDRDRGLAVIDGGEQIARALIVLADLDADGALRHGRQHVVDRRWAR